MPRVPKAGEAPACSTPLAQGCPKAEATPNFVGRAGLGHRVACTSEGRGHCGRRNQQGRGEEGGQAGCEPGLLPMGCASSSCVPGSCGMSWLLLVLRTCHLQRRCCSLRQGALRLLAEINQRGFRIHPPSGNLQPHSEVRLTHSFIWTMLSPSVSAALSRQLLFKQAMFFISRTAGPGIRDQFLQDSKLC